MTIRFATAARPSRTIARLAFLLVLGVWIGAMLYFGIVTAPAAFAALDVPGQEAGRHLAGDVVRIALGQLNLAGIALGVAALVLAIVGEPPSRRRQIGGIVTLVVALLLPLASVVSQFVVSARMEAIRASTAAIDSLAANDPARLEFGRLHGISVAILGAQLVVALLLFFWCGWQWLAGQRASR
jgi:hypothetical protein